MTLVAVALCAASCSGTTPSSTSAEYAVEIQSLIASDVAADDLSSFVSDTEEHVARLIMKDPENAEPRSKAFLEAMFTGAIDDLSSSLDE